MYTSLHNHSMYSIMESIIKPEELITHAKTLGMSAVAITDNYTFAGVHDAYKAAKKSKIKLIVGVQANFVHDIAPFKDFNDSDGSKPTEPIKSLILIAKNQVGYKNILLLNRESFNCRLGRIPLVDWSMLEKYSEGVICLSGDATGILAYDVCNQEFDKAKDSAKRLQNIFGDDFAVEFVANNLMYGNQSQAQVNLLLKKIVVELGLQAVVTSNARYLRKEQFDSHDLTLAIKHGRSLSDRSRPRFAYPQLYLHTEEEIVAFLKRNLGEEFVKILCDTTGKLADKCEDPAWTSPAYVTGDKNQLPTFPVHDQPDYNEFVNWKNTKQFELEDDAQYMRFVCDKNWDLVPAEQDALYRERLEVDEFPVYETLGFSSYMLITSDFINWAIKNDIPVSPGRGSVGGSLTAYLLRIHQADPIKYGLIFSRFLNLEKKEYPDIDNDFASEDRWRVLDYVSNKYGKDFIAHVSNFMTFTPKVAVTDVITTLEIGGSRQEAFKIAKTITETIPAQVKSIESAIEASKLLAEHVKERPEIKTYAEALIGLIRSCATHAAGVVIGKYSLPGLVPLRLDDNGVVVLEWEKTRAEENGLVKIDFLGLETLSIIKNTYKIIEEVNNVIAPKPKYDEYYKEAYELITKGDTLGIFQLGASGGTIGLCNQLAPATIDDLAVINALARPGVPADIKKSYIDRKFGRESVVIPHPNLESAIKATMGYCIFEESFMILANKFCGWDLQRADNMRKISKLKAKGKHILAELKDKYMESSISFSHVTQDFAEEIWDKWIIPLSGYSFNKSHAVLYSMTSLHTAYLKAYYRNEFLTSNLMSETNSNSPVAKDNVIKLRYHLRKAGVKIHPPEVNQSFTNYRLIEKNKLLTGFSALHGVKGPAADEILANRPFESFDDFLLRTSSSKVRAPVVQAFAACGALDGFGHTRKSMFLYCSDLRKKLQAWKKRNPNKKFEYKLPADEWTPGEMRAMEMHYLGEAITGTKSDSYPELFSGRKEISSFTEALDMEEKTHVVVEAEVKDLFFFKVKKEGSKIMGQECCRMLLEDEAGDQLAMVFFPTQLNELRELFDEEYSDKKLEHDACPNKKLEKGFGLRVCGSVSKYNSETSLIADAVYGIFMPVPMPEGIAQLKLPPSTIIEKSVGDITANDVEDDLMALVDQDDQE